MIAEGSFKYPILPSCKFFLELIPYSFIFVYKSYFDALDRIYVQNYVPTIDDVLRVRIPTTGIMEYNFQMRKDVVFRLKV